MTAAHAPSAEDRTAVAIAAGGGMSHEAIARGLGIDVDTLEKHYADELAEGAYLKRRDVLVALHAAALKGNASAAKEYLSGTPQRAGEAAKTEPAKEPKRGKKEQANEDAKQAAKGTGWDALLPGGTRPQ